MAAKLPPLPNALLFVGNQPDNVKSAADAVVAVLKAAGTEGAQVAAVNALATIARAPTSVSIANCNFTGAGKR
jgi:hypothetical protein